MLPDKSVNPGRETRNSYKIICGLSGKALKKYFSSILAIKQFNMQQFIKIILPSHS